MLSLEEFTYLINKYQGYAEFQDKLYDLGIDTINNEWVDFTYKMVRKYMEVYFTDLGWDTIEWWIDEPDNRVLYFTDLFGEHELHLNTVSDLYDFLLSDKEYVRSV